DALRFSRGVPSPRRPLYYAPSSADVSAGSGQRRKLPAPPLNVSLDQSEGSLLSETGDESGDETGDDLDINMDEMDTPDEADSVDFDAQHGEGEEAASSPAASAPGQSTEGRLWRSVLIGEQEHRIDMKSIEPYKRVISHGERDDVINIQKENS
uniref:Uncharacterized protein n=1 Tax=Periophthalmus magnuspinnatus TaxID=409849 RepID=A0A3B3ZXP9_9GOBI